MTELITTAINPAFVTVTLNNVQYNDIVPQDYRFDPETEDLIYGDELQHDMVVLVEPDCRIAETSSFTNPRLVLERNRWCTVTKIRDDEESENVFFIGAYTDGDKVVRQHPRTTGWVVKKDSIPTPSVSSIKEGLSKIES